ncbi:alpha-1,2-mannosyltransferase MNN2 [Saccharomyces eubayanus]|uniref:alpha-1,2-mannosyltransferase MNN2 n=1 Tax=Saccharomyces eubayanus TaxID=1080349 RepID=UPI0006C5E514|nr:MNN2-like protein [Saccharomyces eubayanus]KOH00855.1 MNN2-like protein [Saccharomyces eubayanus]
MLLTKRFSKLFKLAFIALLLCGLFVVTNKYMDENTSVKDYKSHLQNYIDSYANKDSSSPEDAAAADDATSLKGNDKVSTEKLKNFYNNVFNFLMLDSPSGKSARTYNEKCPLKGDIGDRPDQYKDLYKLSAKELAKCLELSPDEVSKLQKSHKDYVEHIASLILPKGTYKGSGIATVGGGKFSLMAFLIIKTLRNMGTTLPVEVLIPPGDEGETEFCSKILPKYNAKCIYVSDILPLETIEKFAFKGYQFKSLALIASSFENLLLLDADNFPIKRLDNIFQEEPYVSTGLVMWPDFWRRTTHPLYYDIAGIPVNKEKRVRNSQDDITPPAVYTKNLNDLDAVPLSDMEGTMPDVSTESGQLMINKSKHLATALLSLFYNVNGPNWYYPIFSQKAAGEGDKETFIAAANFYGLPFYQVKTKTGVEGYHDAEGFHGVAMLQHDFVQDYSRYLAASKSINNKYKDAIIKSSAPIKFDKDYSLEKYIKEFFDNEDLHAKNHVDVMFIHSNLPKFDPKTLSETNFLTMDNKPARSFTSLEKIHKYDIELFNFRALHEYVCVNKNPFKYLDDSLGKNKKEWKRMCDYIAERLEFLESTHEKAIAGN